MSFYTYIFFDPIRDNEPFYVGQGTKERIYKKKNKQVESRRLAQQRKKICLEDI